MSSRGRPTAMQVTILSTASSSRSPLNLGSVGSFSKKSENTYSVARWAMAMVTARDWQPRAGAGAAGSRGEAPSPRGQRPGARLPLSLPGLPGGPSIAPPWQALLRPPCRDPTGASAAWDRPGLRRAHELPSCGCSDRTPCSTLAGPRRARATRTSASLRAQGQQRARNKALRPSGHSSRWLHCTLGSGNRALPEPAPGNRVPRRAVSGSALTRAGWARLHRDPGVRTSEGSPYPVALRAVAPLLPLRS